MASRSSIGSQPLQPRAGVHAQADASGADDDDSTSPASPPPTRARSDAGWSSDGNSARAWLPLSDASGGDSDSGDDNALRAAVVVHGAGDAPPMPALRDFAVAPQARGRAARRGRRGGA
jgi:hypothetical protein